MGCLELQDGRAKSTNDSAILNGEYAIVSGEYFVQHLFIQRLDKTHVVMSRVEAIHLQFADGDSCKITGMSERQDSDAFAILDLTALADGDLLQRRLPLRHDAFSAGITDDKRMLVAVQLGGI